MRRGVLAISLSLAASLPVLRAQKGESTAAPGWELKSPAGQIVRLADYKGKVVVLNFWATWCAPCRREIPDLVKIQTALGASGVAVIGVATDTGSADSVMASARTLGVNYPVVLADGAVIARYGGVESVPMTFIIDRAGRIVAVHTARVDGATLEAEIKPLL